MFLQTRQKIFLASLGFRLVRASRRIARKPLEGVFRRKGFRWELDLREVVDFMIYLTGSFEPSLSRFVEKNIPPGSTVADIGANVGVHTLPMARAVGREGQIIAVEATEYAFAKLRRNIGLNAELAGRIHALHCQLVAPGRPGAAVADSIPSSWPFESRAERHPSHQGVSKSVGDADRVTLDELCDRRSLRNLHLIKIDVDGNEWDVLSGGETTFRRMKPIIVMEVAPDYHEERHEKSFLNIHDFLTGLGYQFRDFRGRQLPPDAGQLAAMLPRGATMNVVVTHRDSERLDYL